MKYRLGDMFLGSFDSRNQIGFITAVPDNYNDLYQIDWTSYYKKDNEFKTKGMHTSKTYHDEVSINSWIKWNNLQHYPVK